MAGKEGEFEMRVPIKSTLAAAALATPLILGVAYTAGQTVGGDDGSGSHTVDQWTIEHNGEGEYTLDREEIDGVVTLVVTGPDGAVLNENEFPDYIAESAEEFGDVNWVPAEDVEDLFDVVDGSDCYDATKVASSRFGYVAVTDDMTLGVESFADGRFEAYRFERALSQGEISGVVESNGSYFDLEGAEVLPPCES